MNTTVSTIRFCIKCDNKYYHMIQNNELIYYCRVCGNKEMNVNKEALCVLDTNVNQGTSNFDYIVNKYTKYDPTLPHIFVHCPNEKCKTNHQKKENHKEELGVTDAIYLRYDNVNLKFLYICTECEFKWKTE